jgi:hypothetical protein
MLLPKEDGSFMQVSGMKFEVDLSVPTPVIMGEDGLFSRVGSGARRVRYLKIWDQNSGTYLPVDLNRRYTIAGFDYQLKNSGSSGIFRNAILEKADLGRDIDILVAYVEQLLKGRIDQRYEKADNRIVIYQ